MPDPRGKSEENAPSIDVEQLSYAFPDGSSGLQDVVLNLPPGSRTLLIGGNRAFMSPENHTEPDLRTSKRSRQDNLAEAAFWQASGT